MKTLLVKRSKANLFRIGAVVFYPGITEIKNENDIKMVQAHPSYKSQIANGVMKEITAEAIKKKVDGDSTDTTDITKMNVKNAIDIINSTFAIPILQDMYERETDSTKSRKTVLQTILDQIKEIKTDPEKDK